MARHRVAHFLAAAGSFPLLELPADVLRNGVLVPSAFSGDALSIRLCREVCRRLRDLVPAGCGARRVRSMRVAARFGYLSVLELLLKRSLLLPDEQELGCPVPKTTRMNGCLLEAVRAGHLSVVVWFRDQGAQFTSKCALAASERGYVDILRYAKTNFSEVDIPPQGCSVRAASAGQLPVLQWLFEQRLLVRNFACYAACQATTVDRDRLQVLEWLASTTHFQPDKRCCELVAASGNLPTLRWLQDKGAPLNYRACLLAAEHGHLPALQWLFKHGCPLHEGCCRYAAELGDLHMLRWLREVGRAEWEPDRVIFEAAEHGHLHVLEYMQEQSALAWGSRRDIGKMLKRAARRGHLGSLEWLLKNNCPSFDWRLIMQAASRPSRCSGTPAVVGVLQWARVQCGEAMAKQLKNMDDGNDEGSESEDSDSEVESKYV